MSGEDSRTGNIRETSTPPENGSKVNSEKDFGRIIVDIPKLVCYIL
jgi:hypothetical protein